MSDKPRTVTLRAAAFVDSKGGYSIFGASSQGDEENSSTAGDIFEHSCGGHELEFIITAQVTLLEPLEISGQTQPTVDGKIQE